MGIDNSKLDLGQDHAKVSKMAELDTWTYTISESALVPSAMQKFHPF